MKTIIFCASVRDSIIMEEAFAPIYCFNTLIFTPEEIEPVLKNFRYSDTTILLVGRNLGIEGWSLPTHAVVLYSAKFIELYGKDVGIMAQAAARVKRPQLLGETLD